MAIAPFRLLLIDRSAKSLLVADGPSGEILAEQTLPLGLMPFDFAIDGPAGRVFLPSVYDQSHGAIYCFQLHSGKLLCLYDSLPKLTHFAVRADHAYFADEAGDLWTLPMSGQIPARLAPGVPAGRCAGLSAGADSLVAVWATPGGGIVRTIASTGAIIQEFCLGGIPTGLTLSAAGSILVPYTATALSGEGVALWRDGALTAISLSCSRCAADNPAYPCHVAVAPDQKTAAVALEEHGAIAELDLAAGVLVRTFPLRRSVSRLAILRDGKFAVATSNAFADLTLIDLVNGRLLSFTANNRELLTPVAVID